VLSRIHPRGVSGCRKAITLIVPPPADMIAKEEASGGTIAGAEWRSTSRHFRSMPGIGKGTARLAGSVDA